jgi:Mn2+/Fe2+ NRAMP family transporter
VETASDAALALTPLAGNYASILFGVGLLAASMLAAGVLPLTTAFSTCEAFGWRAGVRYSYRQAPIFYSIITILIALGVTYSLIPGISLIKPLIFAFVLNGFLLPVELYFMLRLANDKELMGKYVNNALLNIVTGVIMIIVTVAVILFLLSLLPISIF